MAGFGLPEASRSQDVSLLIEHHDRAQGNASGGIDQNRKHPD
jgi:hypothetical protein